MASERKTLKNLRLVTVQVRASSQNHQNDVNTALSQCFCCPNVPFCGGFVIIMQMRTTKKGIPRPTANILIPRLALLAEAVTPLNALPLTATFEYP